MESFIKPIITVVSNVFDKDLFKLIDFIPVSLIMDMSDSLNFTIAILKLINYCKGG